MSDFVPMRDGGGFNAGLIGGEHQSSPPETPVQTGEEAVSQEPEAEQVQLPTSVEELEALMEAVRQEARESAEAVLAESRNSLEVERQNILALCDRIDSSRKNWAQEVRNVLGELVVVGVRQVVSESSELHEEMLRDRFAEVGERLIGEQQVMIRVRPEDEDTARALIGDREGWTVVLDTDISGGIVAETESGKVDATLGAAISGLAESVQEWQSEGVHEE